MKIKVKKSKGITLIALVITIIVLLILAGVSIATLTGDNGILIKAQTAKTETEKASEEEQIQLAALNASMNTKKYYYETGEKDEEEKPIKVPIPAGFAPTQIEGENTVENGFVIVDSKGNEFVWIPVTSEDEYVRNTTYSKIDISSTAKDDTNYLPDELKQGKTETEGEIEKQTVKDAGGFYISRYEAGKEGENILVSKKGAKVWDAISHSDCKEESKKFINNSDVKSALISGIQWDVVMSFINGKIDGKGEIFDVEEYKKSRHIATWEASGKNEADKVCNIYDLSGNYYEQVAEMTTISERYCYCYRGGRSNYDNANHPASLRQHMENADGVGAGFRFVLYII